MELKRIAHGIEKQQPPLAIVISSLVFLILLCLAFGGLQHLLPWLPLAAVVVTMPMFVVHTYLMRRSLRPVANLLYAAKEGERPSRQETQRCLRLLDAFAIKNAFWSTVLWIIGLAIVEAGFILWWGMTGWQIFQVAILALGGAVIDVLLSYHADIRFVGSVRRHVESLLPPGSSAPQHTGNLLQRLWISVGALLALGLLQFAVIWYGRTREAVAERVLAEHVEPLRRITGRLERALGSTEDTQPDKLLLKADPKGRLVRNLLLVDRSGRVIAGGAQIDPTWLERILGDPQALDWLTRRAPFLYLRRAMTKGHELIWVEDLSVIEQAVDVPARVAKWGLLLVLATGLVLAGSVIWSSLQPMRTLSERVSRLTHGELDQLALIAGSGEVAALGRALEEYVGSVRRLVQADRRACDGLSDHHRRLVDSLAHLRQGSDQRLAIAEKTAASVVQMRSSIQTISEQIEPLRQVAADSSTTLFEIEQSVREVSGSSENLQKQVDEVASAIGQIKQSMRMVTEHVEALGQRAEEASASVSAMDRGIQQVEENTSETHRLSDAVTEIASRGSQSVRETIAGIGEIQTVTDEAREVINRLEAQMEAVGKILTVISDVAQKTNLLALNAAIIAASAGEHGKGFAVVADEIKELADRTATSTKEIAGLIKAVQADSRRAVDAIERGSGTVRRGVDLANKAGEALHKILETVTQVNRMASEINNSTTKHGDLVRAIHKSTVEISTIITQIRRAMSKQHEGGQRIERTAESLTEDARFVLRSAGEQVQVVGGASQHLERILEMIGFVSKAIAEQSQGVGHVARAAEEVRDASFHETAQLADVEEIVERIGRVAREVRGRLNDLGRGEER